jgi:small conductance mechanosensitive channel
MGRDFGTSLFSVLVVVVVAFMLWLALASWVDYRLNPSRAVPATAREATLLTLFRNAVTIALVVITLMISLSELGLDIAPLLASAGVLGLAIGFGSQRLVQDIITGIFIQFENAINVGDVVTVGGTTGSVEKLTIRSVSLRDVNGVFHIIPFSAVDRVSNFMRDFSFHVADIGIAYRESTDEAKALMFKAFDDLKAMPEFSRVIIGPLDWHGVTTLGDSAVTLRARIRTRPGSQWAVGRAYNEAVKRRFDEAGVEIPFPHMTVWFGESKDGRAPPLHMTADIQRTPQAGEASPRKPISTTPFGQDAPNKREDDDDDGDDDPR